MSQCVTEETAMDAGFVAEVVAEPAVDAPVNNRALYYGWIMLPLSMGTLIASSPGQTFGISIFNEPMRSSLGLSHGQLAAAYMLGTLLGAIPITYIGRQMDRYGLRRTMLAVVSLFSLFAVCGNGRLDDGNLVAVFCGCRAIGIGRRRSTWHFARDLFRSSTSVVGAVLRSPSFGENPRRADDDQHRLVQLGATLCRPDTRLAREL